MKMTSEQKLGIVDPPEYQCRHIDGMVKGISEAEKFTRMAMFALDKQTVIQANKETHARLDGLVEDLEELRCTIELLRAWGKDWKRIAKRLIIKNSPELLDDTALGNDDHCPF